MKFEKPLLFEKISKCIGLAFLDEELLKRYIRTDSHFLINGKLHDRKPNPPLLTITLKFYM